MSYASKVLERQDDHTLLREHRARPVHLHRVAGVLLFLEGLQPGQNRPAILDAQPRRAHRAGHHGLHLPDSRRDEVRPAVRRGAAQGERDGIHGHGRWRNDRAVRRQRW